MIARKSIPLSKRIFDLLASSFLVVILSPLLLFIALLVWLVHGSPVIFRQQRPGYHGNLSVINFAP